GAGSGRCRGTGGRRGRGECGTFGRDGVGSPAFGRRRVTPSLASFLVLAADAPIDTHEGPLRFPGAPPPWALVLLLVALVLSVRAIYRRERQKVSRPWRIVLGGLRILAISLVALALFRPEREQSRTVNDKSHLVVLLD